MRKIVERVPTQTLLADLEKYRQLAISLGATDAKIIPADQIVVDERVVMKCTLPKCMGWGLCAHCPPHAMKPDQTQRIVNAYRYAIFYSRECDPAELGPDRDWAKVQPVRKNLFEICAKVESAAFYDGYHLALGFWNGSCRTIFCDDKPCQALELGKGCRAPLKARSSMEAVGIDSMITAARVGWDVYPCGVSVKAEDVPYVRRMGMVLID